MEVRLCLKKLGEMTHSFDVIAWSIILWDLILNGVPGQYNNNILNIFNILISNGTKTKRL